MSSQTLQVNGVFKNSELINHQPNKKVYSKPYLFCEKFVPQEFVALCDTPNTKYVLTAPSAVETDGVEGWSNNDNTHFSNTNYKFYFNERPTINRILQDTYSGDSQRQYYEFKFSSPLIIVFYNKYGSASNKYERLSDASVFTSALGRILYFMSTNDISNNNATKTHS
jgi:hypothetical protein